MLSESLLKSACNHHRALDSDASVSEQIVQIADRLASGHDRESFNAHQNKLSGIDEKQDTDYKKARLIPIFEQLKGRDEASSRYELKPLTPRVLPTQRVELSRKEAEEEYKDLWNAFANGVNELDDYDCTNNWLMSINSLLETYFWSVPASSYGNLAETSLYDHLRLTSAFASSLYRMNEEGKVDLSKNNYHAGTNIFRLVQGDFSGIQNFIFDFKGESHSFASKILRAKSFYVNIAVELAAQKICSEFGVPSINIILNAGGKFTALLPNLPESETILSKIQSEINEFFHIETFGQTWFNLASVEAGLESFERKKEKGFSKLLESLNEKLADNKNKIVIENPVFENYLNSLKKDEDGKDKKCKICGYQPTQGKAPFCKSCLNYKKLGEALIDDEKHLLTINNIKKDGIELPFQMCLHKKDKKQSDDVLVWNTVVKEDGVSKYAAWRMANYVPHFTEEDLNNEAYKGIKEKNDDDKINAGEIKTIAHIGADALIEDAKGKFVGKAHIGILKADVDNLGKIFIDGFYSKEGKDSGEVHDFSRTAYLSRMLNYFFVGWLQDEIANKYDSIYTVFAGGDDLFLIGPWNEMIDFSKKINSRLKEYCCNKDIHISAAVELGSASVPVRQLSEIAEKSLKKSKDYINPSDKKEKNAITVFGQTVSWDEFDELYSDINWITDLFEKGVSVGFVYRWLTFINMKEHLEEGNFNPEDAKWIAHFKYSSYRNYKSNESLLLELNRVVGKIQTHGGAFKIPISYCLYNRR